MIGMWDVRYEMWDIRFIAQISILSHIADHTFHV